LLIRVLLLLPRRGRWPVGSEGAPARCSRERPPPGYAGLPPPGVAFRDRCDAWRPIGVADSCASSPPPEGEVARRVGGGACSAYKGAPPSRLRRTPPSGGSNQNQTVAHEPRQDTLRGEQQWSAPLPANPMPSSLLVSSVETHPDLTSFGHPSLREGKHSTHRCLSSTRQQPTRLTHLRGEKRTGNRRTRNATGHF